MYVIVVSNGYPTSTNPFHGIFAFDQIKALSADVKVILLAVDLDSILHKRKWGFEHIFKDGIEIYAINIPLGRVPRPLLSYFGKWGIKKLYKKIIKDHGEPDIIHAHFLGMGEIATAIRYLIENPDKAKKMGENGRRAVFEEFNWGIEEKKLVALYNKLVNN
jgi:glycosyltransferase involved in cell wall biosynthesis